ncbi:MAG: hypothetical protein V2A54_16250, partial [Bacteroidota bacterium]
MKKLLIIIFSWITCGFSCFAQNTNDSIKKNTQVLDSASFIDSCFVAPLLPQADSSPKYIPGRFRVHLQLGIAHIPFIYHASRGYQNYLNVLSWGIQCGLKTEYFPFRFKGLGFGLGYHYFFTENYAKDAKYIFPDSSYIIGDISDRITLQFLTPSILYEKEILKKSILLKLGLSEGIAWYINYV